MIKPRSGPFKIPKNVRKHGFITDFRVSLFKLEGTAGNCLQPLHVAPKETNPEESNLQKVALPVNAKSDTRTQAQ